MLSELHVASATLFVAAETPCEPPSPPNPGSETVITPANDTGYVFYNTTGIPLGDLQAAGLNVLPEVPADDNKACGRGGKPQGCTESTTNIFIFTLAPADYDRIITVNTCDEKSNIDTMLYAKVASPGGSKLARCTSSP